MKKLFYALLLVILPLNPALAQTGETGLIDDLEFVAPTRIPGPDQGDMALCHLTRSFRILGFALTTEVQGYVLSQDNCATIDRNFNSDQLATAQSLNLISSDVPAVAQSSLEQNLQRYGLFVAFGLAILAVIWRRAKSLLGLDPSSPMRKKAAQRVLSAMCHTAKCDGLVGSSELTLIGRTVQRMTGRTYPTAEIIRVADHANLDLRPDDYIAFGKGLRDREKDTMMQAALLVAMADGRMLKSEYEFVTELAHGLGIPGEDFRRVMNAALADLAEQA